MIQGFSQLGVTYIAVLAMIFVGALGIVIGVWLAIAAGVMRPLIALSKRIQGRARHFAN